ncbi:MAG: hypothetical protein IKE43_02430 [Coriobacteriales bacterium]|nr:hypothetical protein [Coriobacteriales bacterium]
MQATLTKWGNSQGVRVPVEVCDALGIHVGSQAEIEFDQARSSVTFRFINEDRRYTRSRKMTIQEFASGWTGPKVGEEWGGPDVGAEVVA